jgi:hypothetical protein
MKTCQLHCIVVSGLLIAASAAASAQVGDVVRGAGEAAGEVVQGPGGGPHEGLDPVEAAGGGRIGAGAQVDRAGRPLRDGVDTGIAGEAGIDARLQARNRSLVLHEDGSVDFGASLRPQEMGTTIRESADGARKVVLGRVGTLVDASADAAAELRGTAKRLDADARARFKVAWDGVREKEKAVKRSLKAARRARGETWVAAREHLASDYETYARAVAEADVIARGESPQAAASESGGASGGKARASASEDERPES